jgi:hypothetical protein
MVDLLKRDIRPPELLALIDLSERPREQHWSLRAALTRYAQPQPQRVSDLLDLVRRIEFALPDEADLLEADGPQLWRAVHDGGEVPDAAGRALGLLRAMAEIDGLGDELARWAADTSRERPDAAVDAVIAEVKQRLTELGVPEQERRPPVSSGPRTRRSRSPG